MPIFLSVAVSLIIIFVLSFVVWRKEGLKAGIQIASTLVAAFATAILAYFAWQQMQYTWKLEAIEQTANFDKFRNATWEIIDHYGISPQKELPMLPREDKIRWLQKLRKLLDSEINNPVLIQNKDCLGHWRNAISRGYILHLLLSKLTEPKVEDEFIAQVMLIQQDIVYVWRKIILESDEVSPTGGLPEQK